MDKIIEKEQARRFVLLQQGLLGRHRFVGKKGAYEYVRQVGCIQFDPIDVCGRNAELTLQSRVRGFAKKDLYDLLYRDRRLVDYTDKELAIFPTEDWPYFARTRQACEENGQRFEGLAAIEARALAYIAAHGVVSAETLPIEGRIRWYSAMHWSGNWHGDSPAARSVLEQLYSTGRLVIHHKEGIRKFYDLAERHLPREVLSAPDPLIDDEAYYAWRVYRRIGAVGLLWNKRSDAFLGIGLTTEARDKAFSTLAAEDKIRAVRVEGINTPMYYRTVDEPYLKEACALGSIGDRCQFVAPLDPMMWDRRLVQALWDYTYTWEIYVPQAKRKYGYYVLPVLYRDRLAGRIETVAKGGVLTVRHVWWEPHVRMTQKLIHALERAIARFAKFNQCDRIVRADQMEI